MENVRKSNIELFRIICIILIITAHFLFHTQYDYPLDGINYWVNFLGQWGGRIGNLGFILISAYYFEKYKFSAKKLFSIIIKATLYSWISMIIGSCFFQISYDTTGILTGIFPLIYDGYGYIQVYVMVYFLSPFIKKGLDSLSEKAHRNLSIILVLFLMIEPLVFVASRAFMNFFLEFIVCFVVVNFLCKYKNNILEKKVLWPVIFLVSVTVILTYTFVMMSINNEESILKKHCMDYSADYFFLLPLAIFSLMMIFVNMKMKYHPFINKVSSLTLGVYLLHEAPGIRQVIWQKIFRVNETWTADNYFVLRAVAVCLIMYVLVLIIELVISVIVNLIKKYFKFKVYESFMDKIDKIMSVD